MSVTWGQGDKVHSCEKHGVSVRVRGVKYSVPSSTSRLIIFEISVSKVNV